MGRPRDRASSQGLLPRMEARPGVRGTSYRYHPVGGKPIPLGQDKQAAIQAVLDLLGTNPDKDTFNEMWRIYQESEDWKSLMPDSKTDYTQCSKPLLKVFGECCPRDVDSTHIYRYMNVERKDAKVRANREKALLSNLFITAIKQGLVKENPCRQVKRNKETPRHQSPEPEVLREFLDWAWAQGGQSRILASAAEFTAVAGNRGVEFRELAWSQIKDGKIRLIRGKGRDVTVVEEITIDGHLADLLARMLPLAKDDVFGWVFPNALGNAYTAQAFKLGFNRLKKAAAKSGKLAKNFTFHDLRHFFVTQYKAKNGVLPELHANPATTERVYNDMKIVKRSGL